MRTTLVFLVGGILGCSGLLGPPRITGFDVVDGGCGNWSATIGVTGARGETVRLLKGSTVVGTWPDVWGSQSIHADGYGTSVLEAQIVGGESRGAVFASEVPFTVASTRPAFQVGASPRFELRMNPTCQLSGFRYRAATEAWDGQGAVAASVTTLSLPPQPEGTHVLQVELLDDQVSLGTVETRFAVGDPGALDLDGDGFAGTDDCDDTDPTVNRDAPEKPDPNGKDDNCDGRVDEGTVAYDDDGDGLSENAGDCDDRDRLVRPGADERADCRDNDCDGQIDEGKTLAHDDDAYERPGDQAYAFPGQGRRFDQDLELVSRTKDDAEVVRFWSDDGDWDDWRIVVSASRLPADSEYDVQIVLVDGPVVASGRLRADGDEVRDDGRSFHDDSGLYEVRIRPTRLYAPYCPVEVSIDPR